MDLVEINLTYLIKGNIFIIPYTISINRLGIKSLFPLLILEPIVILLLI
jgi:hypothetical protein